MYPYLWGNPRYMQFTSIIMAKRPRTFEQSVHTLYPEKKKPYTGKRKIK